MKYQFFPRSVCINQEMLDILNCFEQNYDKINSESNNLKSDDVLRVIKKDLECLNFVVESGKRDIDKIKVPVLFGLNSKIDKMFNADAISADGRIVIEIEAGRATENNQFLKDIFQASMMFNVEYLVLAVRLLYRKHFDFQIVHTFLETLYISGRIQLPLKGILLIGY